MNKYQPGKDPAYKKKVYLKIAKRVYADLKKKGQKPTWNEAQRFASQFVYPKYRNQLISKISNKSIDDTLDFALVKTKNKINVSDQEYELIIPKEVCGSVFKVPNEDIIYIEWWDIGNALRMIPDNIKIRVNAGELGVTDIVKNGEVDYNMSGISSIVEEIRKLTDNGSGPSWNGYRKLVPGKVDDGSDCNYFIDFLLDTVGVDFELTDFYEETYIPSEEELGKRKESLKNLEKLKKQRLKQLEESKSKREKIEKAKTRKRPTEKPKEETITTTVFNLDEQLKQLFEEYKLGIYDAKEYKVEKNRLIKLAEKLNK